MEKTTPTMPANNEAVVANALLSDARLHRGKFNYSDNDEDAIDDLEPFFLVAQSEYPNHGYLATQDEVIEILEQMERGDIEDSIAITYNPISQRDYESLPEFEGF